MAGQQPPSVLAGLRSAHQIAETIRQHVHVACTAQLQRRPDAADKNTQQAYDLAHQLYDVLEGTLSLMDEERRTAGEFAATIEAAHVEQLESIH